MFFLLIFLFSINPVIPEDDYVKYIIGTWEEVNFIKIKGRSLPNVFDVFTQNNKYLSYHILENEYSIGSYKIVKNRLYLFGGDFIEGDNNFLEFKMIKKGKDMYLLYYDEDGNVEYEYKKISDKYLYEKKDPEK